MFNSHVLFLKVSPLPYFVAKQLRAEIAMQVDLGGNIPSFVSHTIDIEFLSEISCLRRTFLRDFEFDQGKRRKLIVSIDRVQEVYSDTEKQDINSGKQIQQLFNRKETKKYSIETSNPAIVGVRAHVENESYCRLTTTVRCSGEEAFSFFWNAESRALRSEREYEREILSHDELEEQDKGPHSQVLHVIEKATSSSKANTTGFKTRRETFSRMVFKKQGGGSGRHERPSQNSKQLLKTLIVEEVEKKNEISPRNVKPKYLITCNPPVSSRAQNPVITGKTNFSFGLMSGRKQSSRRTRARSNNNSSTISEGDDENLRAGREGQTPQQGNSSRFSLRIALGKNEQRTYLDKQSKSSIHIIEVAQDEVKIEVFLNLLMTRRMMNHKIVSQVVTEKHEFRIMEKLQKMFMQHRKLADLDESDGYLLGKMIMATMSGLLNHRNRNKLAITERALRFLEEYKSMKQLKAEFLFFEVLVYTILQGEHAHAHIETAARKDDLELLLHVDGITLGDSFNNYLNTSANEEGAINAWIASNPALSQLNEKHEFFTPLMKQMGKEIRYRITILKIASCFFAMLSSMVDVATDFYTINYYWNNGKRSEAELMLVFICLTISLQLIIAWGVHKKNKKRMLQEMLYTLTFTKPFFNKFRVLTNSSMDGHESMPPITEMMTHQCAEIFAESIPCTVIQVIAILENDEFDSILICSLLISAMVTSFHASRITYIKDINPEDRRTGKLFYGFVPLIGVPLWMMQVCMMLLSFSQLLAKCLVVAILNEIGGSSLAILVLGAEMVAFMMIKVIRRDFIWWLPLGPVLSVSISCLNRIIIKFISDFTGMIHLRHPYEIGGFLFSFNMLYTQISLFAVILAQNNLSNSSDDSLYGDFYIYVACFLSGLWVLSYGGVLFFCMPAYRHTFYATTTIRKFQKKRFTSGDDATKIKILTTTHESTWKDFKDEMKSWLNKVWADLHTNRPDWFTESVISNIPVDMIPGEEAVMHEMDEVSKKRVSQMRVTSRRKSLAQTFGMPTVEDVKGGEGSANSGDKGVVKVLKEVVVAVGGEDLSGVVGGGGQRRKSVVANRRGSINVDLKTVAN